MTALCANRRRPRAGTDNSELRRHCECLLRRNIEWIPNPLFSDPQAEERIEALRGEPASTEPTPIPEDLPRYVAALYEHPLLSPGQERYLFLRMNHLKHRADRNRRSLKPHRPSAVLLDRIDADLAEATAIRNQIVQSNLRLVVALARKFARSPSHLHELISDGHLPLIRAVELFDISRGFRFSTYATWAVRNQMLRSRRRPVEQSGYADGFLFETLSDSRPPVTEVERTAEQEQRLLAKLLDLLTDRERLILTARYGLEGFSRPQSLAQISNRLGLSKERVRQIALTATEKLREAAKQISA